MKKKTQLSKTKIQKIIKYYKITKNKIQYKKFYQIIKNNQYIYTYILSILINLTITIPILTKYIKISKKYPYLNQN